MKDKTAPSSQIALVSMQLHLRKSRNAGQAKSANGTPPDPSGSTHNRKSATLMSEAPHEIGGQLL